MVADQHGVVSRRQLEVLGLEEGAINRRLRAGRLHRVHAGVFVVGHRLLSRQGWWMAAVLAMGEGAVLSHGSAAALWGLRGHTEGPIHVTLPSKSRHVRGICRHSSRVLPADELTIDPLARYPRRRGCRVVRLALARIEESPSGPPPARSRNASCRSSAPMACRFPASTSGSSSATAATRSIAAGPAPGRSSSSTVGKRTALPAPSARTASATGGFVSPATVSPTSPGHSWTMNGRTGR
ncbi:MAG: type IV toxin-antitoxin system AbiEi family antitoxin domain-containing protein [Actinobacteria bacterium]|nr:type IV toxin-antitoxin system AbiEi family antitoxin domain-containing protein [Actinomycetota bacterium]